MFGLDCISKSIPPVKMQQNVATGGFTLQYTQNLIEHKLMGNCVAENQYRPSFIHYINVYIIQHCINAQNTLIA